MKDLSLLGDIFSKDKDSRILITTHHKPDSDAMGSSLGLWNYLINKGYKNSKVVTPTDYGSFLHWMPGNDEAINYEERTEEAKQYINKSDYIFCLDFNSLKRINEMGDDVAASGALKIMIDHHPQPDEFADYGWSDTSASSTSELIYRYILMNEDQPLITKSVAECLYSGILTDTGNFRHDTTSSKTHRIIADLIDAGANSMYIQSQLYDNFTLNRMQFVGYCLSQKMEVLENLNTSLIIVNADELKKYQITTGDTEGLVNMGLSIKGMKLAVLIIDRTKKIKMSFRGKGEFPCNEFARKYFNGGGHFSAAGGESEESLETVTTKFKTYIQEYKNILS